MDTPRLVRRRDVIFRKRSKSGISGAILWIMVVSASTVALSQVLSPAPEKFISATPLDISYTPFRLELTNNSREVIQKELCDPEILRAIATSSGLSEADLATVRVAKWIGGKSVALYQVGEPDKAYNVLEDRLHSYMDERSSGHTKEFVLAAMTNKASNSIIFDRDLAVLIKARPELPADLLKKYDSGTKTNKAGEILHQSTTITMLEDGRFQTNETSYTPKHDELCRWIKYFAVDGDVAWTYFIQLKPDDSLDNTSEQKVDAKEFDPKYKTIIQAVDAEVEAEMKKNGTNGKFGSVHTFWRLKKEKLKANGINWQSPRELNQNIIYD